MRTRRRRPSAGSLPRKATRPPTRSLPRTTARHGKTLAGSPARPLPRTSAGPPPGPRQPRFSIAVRMQLSAQPAGLAPAWQHAASRPNQRAPAWWHADLHEGPTTTPPQLLACLHGVACIASMGVCRSEAERRRTGRASFLSPIKLMDTYIAHLMCFVP